MSEVRIAAEPRTEFGKGAARRVRRANRVPAVLYGHGTDPRHISLPGHELMLALKTPNVLLRVDLQDGNELALPKAVQRDPIKGFLEHVDLVVVKSGEKVTVEVPIHVTGNAAPDSLVTTELTALSVLTEATHIPVAFEVSVEGAQPGTQVHAKDVSLPEGVTLAADAELLVVNVTAAPTAEQLEAELADAEADAGIVHEPAEDATAAASDESGEAAATDAGDAAGGADAAGEGDKADS